MFGSRTKTHSSFEMVAKRTFLWRSKDQKFYHYNKELGERVFLPDDAKLIPLTATNSVTGSRERDHGRATERYNPIFSNEFVDYKNEKVFVKEYDKIDKTKTVLFEGVYSPTIKDAIDGVQYCNFTKNIYCLLDGEVVKLSLSKSSLAPWIKFEEKLKDDKIYLTDGHFFRIGKATHEVHGSVDYYAPTFELGDITPEENEEADRMAAIVEDQLAKNRLAASGEAPAPVVSTPSAEPVEDDSIDLSEIPF